MTRHLLIAGTGRAGTSFLIKYLQLLGLDTGFTEDGAESWSDEANAGLERDLLEVGVTLPYVVKAPLVTEYIDDLLARTDFGIDAVVIPMRDLMETSSSRVITELRQMHRAVPTEGNSPWSAFGVTPGGVLFSLDPVDQARILAVGFHRLVQRLVEADVPIIFLAFPRLVTEPGYVFERLRPFVAQSVHREQAEQIHRALADPAKVRVEGELAGAAKEIPSAETLNIAALKREIADLRLRLAKSEL